MSLSGSQQAEGLRPKSRPGEKNNVAGNVVVSVVLHLQTMILIQCNSIDYSTVRRTPTLIYSYVALVGVVAVLVGVVAVVPRKTHQRRSHCSARRLPVDGAAHLAAANNTPVCLMNDEARWLRTRSERANNQLCLLLLQVGGAKS